MPHSARSDLPATARLIASLPQAMLVIDPARVVAHVNPAAEHLIGQSASRIVGQALAQVVQFEQALINDRLNDGDAQLLARDALVRVRERPAQSMQVMTAPVVDHPGWQIIVLQEIAGVEALTIGEAGAGEGQGMALRAPEILAHEIKNPLAAIRGAAQLLTRRLNPADRTLTGLIAAEVDRIAKLIDQMQTLSRRHPDQMRDCNLHEAARHAQAILQAAHGDDQRAGPLIVEEFDPSLPVVHANHDALVQVVLNLLTNARDACRDQHQPRIIVRTRFASGIHLHNGPGGRSLSLPIELRISDNGPGIAPAVRDHLFEPFVSSKKHGQGLGLALVQKLVRDMHGRVTCDRDDVRGLTHFRLHLPVAGTVAMEREA
jgi:two-component system nitrogen regulation sensor histidine kinase GlnL